MSELGDVQAEVVRRTTWLSIRRYLIIAVVIDLIITLAITIGVSFILAAATTSADRRHAQVACANTATLARIEHVTVRQQASQTSALVKQGFTFGIPKAQFNRLLAQSTGQQKQFLGALDKLARANCKSLT